MGAPLVGRGKTPAGSKNNRAGGGGSKRKPLSLSARDCVIPSTSIALTFFKILPPFFFVGVAFGELREAELAAIEAGFAIRGVAREADIANSMSAIGGKADIQCLLFESHPFRRVRMSAIGGKADVREVGAQCPLIARSGL